MTDDPALRQTFYAAFFAAHVAVIAIALPVAAAFLLPQAERYSVRLFRTLLADGWFLFLLVLIFASVLPSGVGLYFSVVPPADGSNVIPGIVVSTFAGAVSAFLALFERTRRVVQPRALVRNAVEAVSDEDWYGKSLARFGSRRYDKPMSAALIAAFARAFARPADNAAAGPNESAQPLASEQAEAEGAQQGAPEGADPDAGVAQPEGPQVRAGAEADEDHEEDEEDKRSLARRERMLEMHTQREDPLAGATGIALRAIEDHDTWTLGAYASALRDAVLARIRAARAITTYTAEDVAVALVQLACHDHLTPLFALATKADQRAARILLEAMQEIAVGAFSTHPKVASHVVARLDDWLDDALREGAPEELLARLLRVLGIIGREAVRAAADSVATHVVQALTHAGEALPSVFWTDAPHIYNHPDVEEPEAAYSFVIELIDALENMRGQFREQDKLAPTPLVEGTQLIAAALMRRAAAVGCSSYRNELIDRFITQITDDAKRAMAASNDRFAVLPLARLWMLHDTALKCEITDSHDYSGTLALSYDSDALRDAHRLFGIRFDLYEAGIIAESKNLSQAAEYAYKGLITSEFTEGHLRSLYYEWLPKTMGSDEITADGVNAFTGRFREHFHSNLGLKAFGATDDEAAAAHDGDPSPYG